ncbi:MAG: radical SAM protein [Spirochaetota bacterium]|nr:MAG: radical SAM protein [Spirochaetota bacterium]
MKVALVNTNRMKPPIAPIGLEYCAEALNATVVTPEILDLSFEVDIKSKIRSFFLKQAFDTVGVTFRNTDDCAYTGRHSFFNEIAGILSQIRECTKACLIVGGSGFSVMPLLLMKELEADIGIWNDGEFIFPELLKRIARNEKWQGLSNLIFSADGEWRITSPEVFSLETLPVMTRSFFDNRRYFKEGGQAGFETKRGCDRHCIYCADPVAKGNKIRVRSPESVVQELGNLLDQGIDHLHTCDSEFNIPEWHAKDICKEISKSGLEKSMRWFAYCSPFPFSKELAQQMRRSGCAGINFGADSGDEGMLRRLGRDFGPDEVLQAVKLCKDEGITVMIDLLLGGPDESEESIKNTIEAMNRANPDRIGINVGVRVYPKTQLSHLVARRPEGLVGGADPKVPLFWIEPKIGSRVFDILDGFVGQDERYFFFDPSKPAQNYNYNNNERLAEAIRRGYRGAYWDILRRYKEDSV